MAEQMEETLDTVPIPRSLLKMLASYSISEYHVKEVRGILQDYPYVKSIDVPVLIVEDWVFDLHTRTYSSRLWYTLRSYVNRTSPEFTEEELEKWQ